MPQKKSKYFYDGPVYKCNKFITNWKGYTWAVSDRKALCNLSFRFKTENHLLPGVNITLDADYLQETTAVDEEPFHQITMEEYYGELYSN